MKIIILGAGQVGQSLAATLVDEHHDVTLVDQSASALSECTDQLDIRTVVGRCSYPDVLREANADEADMIIAVTDSDEANMVACQVAYSLFHVPIKIARIRSSHYFIRPELFGRDNLPIDVFISPEQLITENILQELAHPGTSEALAFSHEGIKLILIKPYYGGPLLGKTLQQFYQAIDSTEVKALALFRKGELTPLTADTCFETGDELYCVALTASIEKCVSLLRRPPVTIEKIMIAGGGHIGKTLASKLADDYHIKIIDHNQELCEQLSKTLSQTTVLCADAADEDLLINENIETTDLFISLTSDDESNILSALQAKKLGAKRTMALVNRSSYLDLLGDTSINSVILPRNIMIGSILSHIRQGDVVRVHAIRRRQAEAIEAIVHGDEESSQLIGKALCDIPLPKSTQICGLIRGETVIIPSCDTVISPLDHLILLVLDKADLRAIEKLFKVSANFF